MEAVEEKEVAFLQGGPGVPERTHLEEEEMLTGDWQCPSLGVETETLPGEQKVAV